MNYHFYETDFLSRRVLVFAGIAAFHVLIAYLLLTALVAPAPSTPDTRIAGFVIPDPVQLPPVTDAAVLPRLHTGPIVAPPIDDPLVVPQQASPGAPPAQTELAPTSGSALPAPLPVRLLGVNQLPNTADYYPPDMIRLGAQGATNVRVCVDPQGRVLGDPTVEGPSGYRSLDTAALSLVRHGRYARSMQGDTAVGNCFRFRIAFKIQP